MFVICMFISLLLSVDFNAGVFVIMSYFSSFCVNLVIIYYLFSRGFFDEFAKIICAVASVAAILGIVEGIYHIIFPFYEAMFLAFDYNSMSYAMTRDDYRILGTLGNPIVYSVAVIMVIPFVLKLHNVFIKSIIIVSILLATFLTYSRSPWIVLFSMIFFSNYSKRKLFVLVSSLILISGFLFFNPIAQSTKDVIIEKVVYRDAENITIRSDLFQWALSIFFEKLDMVSITFGNGIKSSVKATYDLSSGQMNTIDNVYATVLYEYGIMGLFFYSVVLINVLRYGWNNKDFYFASSVGFLLVGFSFTTIYYFTVNFVWVAIVATQIFLDERLQTLDTQNLPG